MTTLTTVLEYIGLGAKSSADDTSSKFSTIWVYVPIAVGGVAWYVSLRFGASWWLALITLIGVTALIASVRVLLFIYLANKKQEDA